MVSTVSGAINDVGSRDLIELSRRGAAAWSDSSQTPLSATPNSDGQPVSVPTELILLSVLLMPKRGKN